MLMGDSAAQTSRSFSVRPLCDSGDNYSQSRPPPGLPMRVWSARPGEKNPSHISDETHQRGMSMTHLG